MVPRQNCFQGSAFPATRGKAQVILVSPTLFNVVVYRVIRTWLVMTVEDQRVANYRLGDTVGQCLGVFYDNDGMVGSLDSDWLQHNMNVLFGLFRRYVLDANVANSNTITCQPGTLQAGISEDAMVLKCTGLGDLYQVRLRRKIPCLECGVELATRSMTPYHRCMHRTEPAIDWSRLPVSQTVHQPQVYNMRFPHKTKLCPCPFPRFLGLSRTWNVLSSQFNRQKWGDMIRILEEHLNPLPRCEQCGIQVPEGSLNNRHYTL